MTIAFLPACGPVADARGVNRHAVLLAIQH
jgi:hypothetical protein